MTGAITVTPRESIQRTVTQRTVTQRDTTVGVTTANHSRSTR